MTPLVFIGPTLAAEAVQQILPTAKVSGPAGWGDIYRAARDGVDVIALVDGYFDQRLAVWHKELLWAISRGVRVYGAASMGALRAAELHRFGMIGAGRIFDWYVSGEIEADDEVAVAHESADRGFRPVSEAMVNIRATLLAADDAGVIRTETRTELIDVCRSMFYPTRKMREVLTLADERGVDGVELSRLRDWIAASAAHAVDQKQADAIVLLERVRGDNFAGTPGRDAARFDFEYTELWHEFTQSVGEGEPDANRENARSTPSLAPVQVQAEASTVKRTERIMQLLQTREPALAASLIREAERRAALLERAAALGLEATPAQVQAASDDLRHERNLLSPASTLRWLNERGLDIPELTVWMEEEVLLAQAREQSAAAARHQLRRVLHASADSAVISALLETVERTMHDEAPTRRDGDER